MLAPSLSGENDVCSVAVSAAPALAGSAQQTSNAITTTLILDMELPARDSPIAQVDMLPLRCTVTEPLRRWIVPLKLSPEPCAPA